MDATADDVLSGKEPWAVICGDALEVLPGLPAGSIGAVVADPPYGIGFDFAKRRPRGPAKRKPLSWRRGEDDPHAGHRDWRPLAGDRTPFDPAPWLAFPAAVLWGANHYAHRLPPSPCWLVWDKRDDSGPDSFSDCELAWTSLPGCVRKFPHLWRGVVRAGEENVANGAKLHPCQKPVALMHWCLSLLKLPAGAVVLDPYCGSGTTGVACRRLGLRFVGVEIDPAYAGLARRRIAESSLVYDAIDRAAPASRPEPTLFPAPDPEAP